MHNLIPDVGFNGLVKGRHGYFVFNLHDEYIGKSLGIYGEWSEEEVLLFQHMLCPGDVVIEVGSNIGSHTVPLAKAVGKDGFVYAFEPQRIIYQMLCANLALNSLTNVDAYQAAVSSENGTTYIPYVDYSLPNNFGGIRAHSHTSGIATRQVALDDAFSFLPRLNLLKVDAEDMERLILQGGQQLIAKHRPFMYLENDSTGGTMLLDCVHSMKYTIYKHVIHLFNPNNYMNVAENYLGNFASFNILCIPNESNYRPPHIFHLKAV